MTTTRTRKQTTSTAKPRVLIDWKENGDFTVYADGEVEVFSRSEHIPDDMLYRFSPDPIPEGWLDGPFGYIGDGSLADATALFIARIFEERRKRRR